MCSALGRFYRMWRFDLQHCLQQSVVSICKCRDISLPGQSRYSHVPFCTDDSHIPEHCRRQATEDCFRVGLPCVSLLVFAVCSACCATTSFRHQLRTSSGTADDLGPVAPTSLNFKSYLSLDLRTIQPAVSGS